MRGTPTPDGEASWITEFVPPPALTTRRRPRRVVRRAPTQNLQQLLDPAAVSTIEDLELIADD